MAPVLEFRDLEVRFGRKKVLYGLSAAIGEGEAVALLGANGSGKSTTLRAAAGLVKHQGGQVLVDGADASGLSIRERVARGLTLLPQGRRLFGSMPVEDNLRLGAFLRHDRDEVERDVERTLFYIPELADLRKRRAAELSGGQQQLVAVGRGVMARPRVLMLDEPSLGVAPVVTQRLASLLKQLREDVGITIVLVEQNVSLALELADRVLVLRTGRIALDETPDRLADLKVLEDIYFGR